MPPAASQSPAIGTHASPPETVRVDRRRRHWFPALLLILTVAAVAAESWRAFHTTTAVRYVTVPVTRGAVTRAVTASGSVNPVTTIQVGTYVSAGIQQLYGDDNTQGRRRPLCAKIDPRPCQTTVRLPFFRV